MFSFCTVTCTIYVQWNVQFMYSEMYNFFYIDMYNLCTVRCTIYVQWDVQFMYSLFTVSDILKKYVYLKPKSTLPKAWVTLF